MCTSLFGASTPRFPQTPSAAPKRTDSVIAESTERTRAIAAQAQGRSSSIATSNLGLRTPAQVVQRQITGF